MKKIIAVLLITASALMTGCAGTSSTMKKAYSLPQGEKLKLDISTTGDATKDVSDQGMSIFKDRLIEQLTASNLLAGDTDASNKTIEVVVTNYYMRHGATRATVGIFAGADNVQSTVKVKNTKTGEYLSEFTVESKNPTAWGTAHGMIQDHADEIVATLKKSK